MLFVSYLNNKKDRTMKLIVLSLVNCIKNAQILRNNFLLLVLILHSLSVFVNKKRLLNIEELFLMCISDMRMFELAIIYFTGSDIQFGASMRTIHIFDTLMLIFDESNLLKTDFSPVDFGTIFDIENLFCV